MKKSVSRSLRVNAARWSLRCRLAPQPAIARFASTATTSHTKQNGGRIFWTTSRAILLSAFAGSIAYAIGVTDAGSHVEQLWPRDPPVPAYGKAKDLEKVRG